MPLSPIIVRSPLNLFLGAGASAPLGKLLMGDFIERIAVEVKDNDLRTMLQYLIKFRGGDLEALLGELETIIGLNYAQSVDGTVHGSSGSAPYSFSLSVSVARTLLRRIKHLIIQEYRFIDRQKSVELYEPLFDLLFSTIGPEQCLVVFTTNYDLAIEEFCEERYADYNLCDGFVHGVTGRYNFWSRSNFDGFQPDSAKRNVVLFKIHGSVDWVHSKAIDKITRGPAMFDALDSDAYSNVLIYPATNKITTVDPYYSGYEYLHRCSEKALKLLAIGYSFRDYEATTRLRSAVALNDQLHLVLVSPNADKAVPGIPIPTQQKSSINGSFGEAECLEEIKKVLTREVSS